MSRNIKMTLRADYEAGEGSLGNVEKWRDEVHSFMRIDLLNDWIYDLKQEYDVAMEDYYTEEENI